MPTVPEYTKIPRNSAILQKLGLIVTPDGHPILVGESEDQRLAYQLEIQSWNSVPKRVV